MKQKTDDAAAERKFLVGLSPREIIERNFKVEAKQPGVGGSKIIPFKLNEGQDELFAAVEAGHTEHVIPKPRQMGISSGIEAYFLAECLTTQGIHAAVISHEASATRRLLRRVQWYLDRLKEDGYEVNVEVNNVHEKTFPDTGSNLYIGTAGQRSFSRGDTLNRIHASEVAFWPNPAETMAALTGAMVEGGLLFLESTGNGAGGYFYNQVKKAQRPGASAKLHFPDWRKDKSYAKTPPPDFQMTSEEIFLVQKYKLTPEQIYWRRSKIEKFDSTDTFCVEYPLSVDECFLATGTSYFEKTSLRLYQRLVKDPLAVGIVEDVGGRPKFEREEGGWLSVWEYPKTGVEFLIAADCSEGLEDEDSDDAVGQVINRANFSQAAVIAGKIDPTDMGKHLWNVGRFYGYPWIAVEDNGPGLTVLAELKRLNYPRIYRRKSYDLEADKEVERYGWHTDLKTRMPMLGELRSALKRQALLLRDSRLLQQCTTFCRQKDLTFKANFGCHDDHVMSAAIAAFLHKIIPCIPSDGAEFFRFQDRFDNQAAAPVVRNSKTGY